MSISISPRIVAGVNLDELVDALLRADPDILEIVLFGSAAYAPDLARDVDVLVLTRHKKEMDIYFDAAWSVETPLNVDVIPKQVGEEWGKELALSVFAIGIRLYGDQITRMEAKKNMGVPTYEQARILPFVGAEVLDMANSAQDPLRRDLFYKDAFNKLFDAARYAVMTFLATENSRWGQLARELSKPFESRFREMISVLHIQYFYQGTYPQENTNAEFYKWRATVNQFIDDLEKETQARQAKSDQEEHETE